MAKILCKLKGIFTLSLFLLLSTLLQAGIRQNIEKPDTLWLGSRIYLLLSAGEDLADIVKPDTLTRFAILAVEKVRSQGQPTALKITIIPLDTGTQTFPALQVISVPTAKDSLFSKAFTLTIREARSPKDTTLVDIAGAQKLPGELPWWAYYLIGGVLLLAVVALLIYLLLKRKKPPAESASEPVIPQDKRSARQKAVDALNDLQKQKLPEQEDFILFHYRLSEILKLFLEEELGFNANEMTTREIRQHFRRKPVSAGQLTEKPVPGALTHTDETALLNWLENCDRIKFAKQAASSDECNQRLNEIREWFVLSESKARAAAKNGIQEKPPEGKHA